MLVALALGLAFCTCLLVAYVRRVRLARMRESFERLTAELARREADEERRRARSLEEQLRARDEFLSIAAHELRTPLTPVLLQLSALRRVASQRAEVPSYRVAQAADIGERSVMRLRALVDQLLDVSALLDGQCAVVTEDADMSALVADAVESVRADARRAGCEIRVSAPAVAFGRWDVAHVGRALRNLVANAVKFGPGAPIDVTVDVSEERVRVSIEDRGIGIAPEAKARIFERFERAVPVRSYGGLGLGLWLARTAIEAQGGCLAVESAPGRGSTFTLALPRDVPMGSMPPACEQRTRRPLATSGVRVRPTVSASSDLAARG